jgi:16S rRNA (cytosine967-C5)-methyltransferase
VAKLAAFREGLFQVQSEAAQICSHLLAPTPGDRVLDICAGVGGKTTHLAQIAKDRGAVLGLDISHGRLLDLRQSAYRLGLGSVRSVVADAERELPFLLSKPFDRIMVDAPCSALGVIARHPDAKWTRREEDVRRLARTQCRILEKAAPLLRAGGHLLYVTCTVSMEENEGVVGAFLSRAKGMAQEDLRGRVPGWASPLIDERGFFQSLPHVHGIEGFFGALFTKKRG